MTDRELLEAAAKAAGRTVMWESAGVPWNPFDDDGQALRLAVALRLEIDTSGEDQIAVQYLDVGVREWTQGDPYAATRRAIVRAAAAMGD